MHIKNIDHEEILQLGRIYHSFITAITIPELISSEALSVLIELIKPDLICETYDLEEVRSVILSFRACLVAQLVMIKEEEEEKKTLESKLL